MLIKIMMVKLDQFNRWGFNFPLLAAKNLQLNTPSACCGVLSLNKFGMLILCPDAR